MSDELTVGAIRSIRLEGSNCVDSPVLQCLSVKKVGNGPQDRYRAIISDSQCFIQAMFATQLNYMVEDDTITRFSVIKVQEYTVNTVKEKTIIIIHSLELLSQGTEKIGEPASVDVYIQAEGAPSDPVDGGNDGDATSAAPAAVNPYAANTNNGSTRGGRGGSTASTRGRGGATNSRGGGNTGSRNNSSTSGGGGGQSHPIYPIEGLSPYQNKWTIKARVTNKSDIRHWSNAKGEGKLFSFTLLDETGEIKVTGFNDQVDAYHAMIEEGKVYFVSKAKVGIAKKQFSNVNNEYEITLESGSDISLCTDTDNVPQVKYNFVELSDLQSSEPNSMIDVIGVVKDVGEISQITSKATQKPVTKRELTIVDSTGMSVRLTLWGRGAENFTAGGGYNEDGSPQQPVIAFKGVRVGDFGGRSLSMVSSSSMMVDPDISEAHSLRGWYDTQGSSSSFVAYTNAGAGGASGAGSGGSMRASDFKHIGEAKDAMLGTSDEPDFFCIRAQLVYVKKENFAYPACPADRCNKKMHLEEENQWRCEKCEKTYEAPEYRYVLSGQFADFTGFIYFSCFNEIGHLLMGISADEMQKLKEDDEAHFNAAIDKAMGITWNLSIKAKNETYNDQQKIRYNVIKAVPASWGADEATRLMQLIDSYGA